MSKDDSQTPLSLDETGATFLGNLFKGVRVSREDMHYWNGHLKELHDRMQFLHRTAPGQHADWIGKVLKKEATAHARFFDLIYALGDKEYGFMSHILAHYGQEKIDWWKSLDLEVHYLPQVTFTEVSDFKGWRDKPIELFWQALKEGDLYRMSTAGELVRISEVGLGGIVALIDTRIKPHFQNGKQMFANDSKFMGGIIERLRESGKLAPYGYGLQPSRFGISSLEWQEYLRPAVAEFLGLEAAMVRLETTIEANVIPQLYPHMPRSMDGGTNTWCWYEEYFNGTNDHLLGGRYESGGLAYVGCYGVDYFGNGRAVRPLVVLSH